MSWFALPFLVVLFTAIGCAFVWTLLRLMCLVGRHDAVKIMGGRLHRCMWCGKRAQPGRPWLWTRKPWQITQSIEDTFVSWHVLIELLEHPDSSVRGAALEELIERWKGWTTDAELRRHLKYETVESIRIVIQDYLAGPNGRYR